MQALNKKALRDLWNMRTQVLAVIAVMSCGIGVFCMSASTHFSLESTRDSYYREFRFADVFARLKRAPESLADRLRELPGVQSMSTRVIASARLQVSDMLEPAQALFISLPPEQEIALNGVCLRRGRWPSYDQEDEIVVSETFANAHHLTIGDDLLAILHGRQRTMRIVGFALAPEFIYEIQPGGIFPDNRAFGVIWMNRKFLSAAVDMVGAFNDVAFQKSLSIQNERLITEIDEILKAYGGQGAITRKDQFSHRFISNELDEIRRMGLMIPAIFLSAAAFLMNMILSRLIAAQRVQIAALMAFGYSRWSLAKHYFLFAMIIAVASTSIGLPLGAAMGTGITAMYSRFFHFPSYGFSMPSYVVVLATAIACLAGLAGVWTSVRAATRLRPAEAMRPESPVVYRSFGIEGVIRWISRSVTLLMIFRHLVRRPWRALQSVFGISLAVAVLIVGAFMQDAIYSLFDVMFRQAQRFDLQLVFIEPQSKDILTSLRAIDSITACEGFRAVPIRISQGTSHRLISLMGVDGEPQLSRLIDHKERTHDAPIEGLLLSNKLAKLLRVRPGEPIFIEVLEGQRPAFEMSVASTIDDFAGMVAYCDQSVLARLLDQSQQVSGAYLRVDPDRLEEIFSRLKTYPQVAEVLVARSMRESFQKTLLENIRILRSINLLFSCIIAIGVVYSTARISMNERSRELATLRVLGFSQKEVVSILFGEVTMLTFVALPLGWLFGTGLAFIIVSSIDQELFRIPLVIRLHTYIFAASVVLLTTYLSLIMIRREVAKLSLVEVLKSAE